MVANAMGLQLAGLSCICNWASGISKVPLTHEDVNQTTAEAMPRMKSTITHFRSDLEKSEKNWPKK